MGLQSARSTFGFAFSSLPLGILNLFSLLLFPWTLSILLSPGLIWYSTNWLHQKVIMPHTIVTLLFLPLFTSNLSTCQSCFTGSKTCQRKSEILLKIFYYVKNCIITALHAVHAWSWWLNVLYSAAGKTFQLYSHNLIGLFEQLKKPGLAAQFQTHRFPDKILPRWDQTSLEFLISTPVTSVIWSQSQRFQLWACSCAHAVQSFCL